MFEFDIYFDWKHDIFVKKKHTFRKNSRVRNSEWSGRGI